MIRKEKWDALIQRMKSLHIEEDQITEKFILGGGKGGQNLHKTASCVYLKHHPTGIEVKCQKERFQHMNRFFARKELCEKIEAISREQISQKQKLVEKKRRQKQRRSRKAQAKVRKLKDLKKIIKTQRSSPQIDE